jgi:hypothetical protein
MSRGQYKGSRTAVQQLRLRKVIKLAGEIRDEEHFAHIVSQLPSDQRGEFLKVVKPYLKFEFKAEA